VIREARKSWRLHLHQNVIIQVGATITGPQADLNLGITTFVNGAPMNPVQLDTTQAATDTIQYVATDSAGLSPPPAPAPS
jgi:hypothetical protein